MGLWRDFGHAVARPLVLFEDFKKNARVRLAAVVVALACLCNALAAPAAGLIFSDGSIGVSFDVWERMGIMVFSMGSFIAACALFKLLAVMFHKDVALKEIIATWGVSFLPTLLCILMVEASEAGFYLFMGNLWAGLILCLLLVLLLAWKVILFFIEVSVTLGLKGGQTVAVVVITGVVYGLIIFLGFKIGVKVPML